jgi:aldose 1-epimerase
MVLEFSNQEKVKKEVMKPLDPALFQGRIGTQAMDLFVLSNGGGLQVAVTNYGARILQVLTPDRSGHIGDVVLGYASLEETVAARSSVGAFIGRYAGRIGNAQLNFRGQHYPLSANDGPHCLHGGLDGLRFKAFQVATLESDRLVLAYRFENGEMGFPGVLDLRLEYRVTQQQALEIAYHVCAIDQPCVASFTSHAYFNLNGADSGTALDHEVIVHADHYMEVDARLVATGRLIPTLNTAYHLKQRKPLSKHLSSFDLRGFDDCYLINPTQGVHARPGDVTLMRCAEVFAPRTGRSMEVWSSEPALQFYTGLNPSAHIGHGQGKSGRFYQQQEGLCFEPQAYPNAPNCPAFPLPLYEPGVVRSGKTVYLFKTF